MYNFLKFNPSVFCAHGASKRKGEPLLYSTVLFDLDGTLIESGPGIFAVTREVLKDMGLEGPDDERIRKMVGPPLRHSFRDVIGVPEERAEEAAQKYMAKAKSPTEMKKVSSWMSLRTRHINAMKNEPVLPIAASATTGREIVGASASQA